MSPGCRARATVQKSPVVGMWLFSEPAFSLVSLILCTLAYISHPWAPSRVPRLFISYCAWQSWVSQKMWVKLILYPCFPSFIHEYKPYIHVIHGKTSLLGMTVRENENRPCESSRAHGLNAPQRWLISSIAIGILIQSLWTRLERENLPYQLRKHAKPPNKNKTKSLRTSRLLFTLLTNLIQDSSLFWLGYCLIELDNSSNTRPPHM